MYYTCITEIIFVRYFTVLLETLYNLFSVTVLLKRPQILGTALISSSF